MTHEELQQFKIDNRKKINKQIKFIIAGYVIVLLGFLYGMYKLYLSIKP